MFAEAPRGRNTGARGRHLPTPRQIRLARRLGVPLQEDMSRGQLSVLIDKVLREEDVRLHGRRMSLPATEEQKAYARDLGIEFDPEISRRTLSILIDEAKYAACRPSVHSEGKSPSDAIEQMLAVLRESGRGAVIIMFDIDDTEEIWDTDDLRNGQLAVEVRGHDVPETYRRAIEEAFGTNTSQLAGAEF